MKQHIVSRYFHSLLCFFLVIAPFTLLAHLRCDHVYQAPSYWKGELASKSGDNQNYLLGQGDYGRVYRIVHQPTGNTHIEKHYRTEGDAATDFYALKFLSDFSQVNELTRVRVHEPLFLEDRVISFPDLKGRALLNEENPYNQAQGVAKDIAKQEFALWQKELTEKLKDLGFDANVSRMRLPIISSWAVNIAIQLPEELSKDYGGLPLLYFQLLEKNAVVRTDGQLFLVDPN